MQAMSAIEIERGSEHGLQAGWDFMQAISALKINSVISSLPPVGNIQRLAS